MKLRNFFASMALLLAVTISAAHAATIFSDNFESYADTTAMNAVWTNGGTATLDASAGNPGQSMDHPGTAASFSGGNTNTVSFAEIIPTANQKLIYTADIFDDGTSANKRTTAGIRRASGANLIEMGMYNGPSHYAYRVILFGGGDPSWVAFSNLVDDTNAPITNSPVAGWHRFQVELTANQAKFSLDLNSDGIINGTAVVGYTLNAAGGFNVLRLGGPSDLGSAGGGVKFDNISLELVPEPASLMLLGLMGLALGCVRTRR